MCVCAHACRTWEDVVVARASIQLPPSCQSGRPANMLQWERKDTGSDCLLLTSACCYNHFCHLSNLNIQKSGGHRKSCNFIQRWCDTWNNFFFSCITRPGFITFTVCFSTSCNSATVYQYSFVTVLQIWTGLCLLLSKTKWRDSNFTFQSLKGAIVTK